MQRTEPLLLRIVVDLDDDPIGLVVEVLADPHPGVDVVEAVLVRQVLVECPQRSGDVTDDLDVRLVRAVDLGGLELVAATDVRSILTGPAGAAAVFGPQKGLGPGDVARVDAALEALVPVLAGARMPLGKSLGPDGIVQVARDLGLKEIVRGQTPFVDGEIDSDIENYLTNSEQIASALACETLVGPELDVAVSAGILVQTLPGSSALAVLDSLRAAFRAGALARTLVPVAAQAGDVQEHVG